jgi:hypothetical protein
MCCRKAVSYHIVLLLIFSWGFSRDPFLVDDKARVSPGILNYQGYLIDSMALPINDTLDMTFKIFDDPNTGSEWWSEIQTAIPIEQGIFHVILGDITLIPDSVFTSGTNRWLEITLQGSITLSPRTRMASAGYAVAATYADTAEYARFMGADNDWSVTDSVLQTDNYWGLARGNAGNIMHGTYIYSHINFGVECTTGHASLNERYATVSGGYGNAAIRENTTVSGGYSNHAFYDGATVSGGYNNTANGEYSTVAGGLNNIANNDNSVVAGGWSNNAARSYSAILGGVENRTDGAYSAVSGGYQNYCAAHYSAILGGYADTIIDIAQYSYLFGIGSKLTEDSTFMVDMPYIRFGDEITGYEFPAQDGAAGDFLITDGSGQLYWYSDGGGKWAVSDSVLLTKSYWGLARGSAENALYGTKNYTHTNFGNACTTGINGADFDYITICGGYHNRADSTYSSVVGGYQNRASGRYSFIGAGQQNNATNLRAGIVCGALNTASGSHSFIGSGYNNTAGDIYVFVGGGSNNNASANNAVISGGSGNFIEGDYSAILGGRNDSIMASADYSYLFGINSKLTEDSTFMVDMPHIHFGDVTSGYEFPDADGSADQIMVTDGSSQLSWQDSDTWSHWVMDDSTLFTKNYVGLSRGNAGNELYGTMQYTHTNFGNACTTGIGGLNLSYITISGGFQNHADSSYATITGGLANKVHGAYSCIGGGCYNSSAGEASTISGGAMNSTSLGYAGIGGGFNNNAIGLTSFIGGGLGNRTYGIYAGVLAGNGNRAGDNDIDTSATIVGGWENMARSKYSFIGGGKWNWIEGDYAVILGGFADTISSGAHYSYLFGINSNLDEDSTFMVDIPHIRFGDATDGYEFPIADGSPAQFMVTDGSGQLSWENASSFTKWSVVDSVLYTDKRWGLARGGAGNILYGTAAYTHNNFGAYSCTTGTSGSNYTYITVCGGSGNRADSAYAAVVGGIGNKATGRYAFVGGGVENKAQGYRGCVLGGYSNEAREYYSVAVGGYDNTAGDMYSFVGGGYLNIAAGYRSFVGGGYSNLASADYAAVVGGYDNHASGAYSFAGGRRARAAHAGTFVWADGTDADFSSTAANQFLVRASGGMGINTDSAQSQLHISGGTGSVDLFIEADTDDSGESDQPSITLSQDNGAVTGKLGYFNGTNQLTLKNIYSDAIILGTNDSPQLMIDATGRSYFYNLLRVQDDSWPTTGKGMELAYDSSLNRGYIQVYDRDAAAWGVLYLGQSKVGIGIANPTAHLDVVGDDTLGRLLIAPSGTPVNYDAELLFGENEVYEHGMSIKYDGGTNQLGIYGNSSGTVYGPHMLVDRDDGDVHIGSTAGSARLYVNAGSTVGKEAVYGYSSSGEGGFFSNNTNDYYALTAWNGTGTGAVVRALYAHGHIYATGGYQTFMGGKLTGFSVVSADQEIIISGSATLVQGRLSIDFPADIRSAVSEDIALVVTVTPTSECNGVFISKKSTHGFEVKELMSGKSNATFDWIAIARAKGYEDRIYTAPLVKKSQTVIKPVNMED